MGTIIRDSDLRLYLKAKPGLLTSGPLLIRVVSGVQALGIVEASDGGANEGARGGFQELNSRWHPFRHRIRGLLGQGVATFNDAVGTVGIPPAGGREGPGS